MLLDLSSIPTLLFMAAGLVFWVGIFLRNLILIAAPVLLGGFTMFFIMVSFGVYQSFGGDPDGFPFEVVGGISLFVAAIATGLILAFFLPGESESPQKGEG